MEELITWFQNVKLEIFIPAKPLANIYCLDRTKTRDFLIQGEILRFYLVIHASSALKEWESKSKINENTLFPDWKISFYRLLMNLRLRIQFSNKEPSSETEPLVSRLKKPNLVIASNVLKHRCIKIEAVEDIRPFTTSLNVAGQLSPRQQTSASNSPSNSPLLSSSHHPLHSAMKIESFRDTAKENANSTCNQTEALNSTDNFNVAKDFWHSIAKAPNCCVLSNGDIVYTLETLVALKAECLENVIYLIVTVTPGEHCDDEDGFDIVSKVRSVCRNVSHSVKLVVPLAVHFDTKVTQNVHDIITTVQNKHFEPLTIENVEISLKGALAQNSLLTEFDKYYRVEIKSANFPWSLKPQEVKMFALSVSVIPVYQPKATRLHLEKLFQPMITFFWSLPSILTAENETKVRYTMTSRYDIPFPPPCMKSLFVMFYCQQPVKLSSMFTIKITIVNLAPYSRDIVMEVPTRELDPSDEWVYATKTKNSSVVTVIKTEKALDTAISENQRLSVDMKRSESSSSLSVPKTKEELSRSNTKQPHFDFLKDVKSNISQHESTLTLSSRDETLAPNNRISNEVQLEIHKDRDVMIAEFLTLERKRATIICIDKIVKVGIIEPQSEVAVNIRCLAFQEGVYHLEDIKLYDRLSKKMYRVKYPFQVAVVK
jgi:hypothetical protein